MKKRVLCGCSVIYMVVLVSAITADAKGLKGRFGVELFGGFSRPSAGDYNEEWNDHLEYLLTEDWDQGEVDKLESTTIFGVNFKYGLTDKVLVALGYLKDSGEAGLTVTDTVNTTEYEGTQKQDIETSGIILSLYYIFHDPPGLNVYGGIGAGRYSSEIKHRGDDGGHPDWIFYDWNAEGEDTVGFHLLVGSEYFLSDTFSLNVEVMYRSLTIEEFTITKHYERPEQWEGEPLDYELDQSGIVLTVSGAIYI